MTTVNPILTHTYNLHSANPKITLGANTKINVGGYLWAGVYGGASVNWTVTNLGSITASSAMVLMGDATIINGASGKLVNNSGAYTDIYVGGTGNVTNNGSITHAAKADLQPSAIYLKGGGVITNNVTGSIFGNVDTGGEGTITNKGVIADKGVHFSAVNLTDGGTVTNSGKISVSGFYGSGIFVQGAGTITNSGLITGTAEHVYGIDVKAGGVNSVIVTNSGLISLNTVAHGSGINLEAGGAATNKGGITVTASAGYISGVVLGAGGSFTNSGGVTVTTGAHASGVDLTNGGTFTNTGGIVVKAAFQGAGVNLGNGGAVDNEFGGSIVAKGLSGIFASGSTGVFITDAGVISGGASINLANSGTKAAPITNFVTLETGADLIGAALGSTGQYVTNALELLGSDYAFNSFVNFQTLTVEQDANWTLEAATGVASTTVVGELTIAKSGSLSGSTTIEGGTAIFDAAYAGAVIFDGTGELELGAGYTGKISGLAASDEIDFLTKKFAQGDQINISGTTLSVETSGNSVVASVALGSNTYTSGEFSVGADTGGNVLITFKGAV